MSTRDEANAEAVRRLCAASPVVTDVAPALDVLPGYTKNLILTSGAPLPWPEYTGGQREAIIDGALYEGLAATREDADRRARPRRDHASAAATTTAASARWPASTPRRCRSSWSATTPTATVAFCNFYEGKDPRRLNYGCYDEGVREPAAARQRPCSRRCWARPSAAPAASRSSR